jgi:hypothetical protein
MKKVKKFKFDAKAWHANFGSNDEVTQYVGPLDDTGRFEAPTIKKNCGGKEVHFYVTVLAPPSVNSCVDATTDPQPWPAPPSSTCVTDQWKSTLDCSHKGQSKSATINTCNKNEHTVDTNISGSTSFTWSIQSENGGADEGVILLCTTKSTS